MKFDFDWGALDRYIQVISSLNSRYHQMCESVKLLKSMIIMSFRMQYQQYVTRNENFILLGVPKIETI